MANSGTDKLVGKSKQILTKTTINTDCIKL